MKKILYACLTVVLIAGLMTGCESKEEKEQAIEAERFKQEQVQKAEHEAAVKVLADKKAAEDARLAEERAKNPSMINNMGVSMDDGKLIIDTNKAKEFFVGLQEKLDNTSKEIDREMREGNLTITIPAGLEVTNETISIDINKSKSFFDSWGERMADFAKEFDTMTEILHSNTQTQGEEK